MDRVAGRTRQKIAHEQRPERTAAELREPVDGCQRRLDPAGDEEAERDRGVEVAARDVAKSRDHHGDRHAMGDRDADEGWVADGLGRDDRPRADEDEREGPDELGHPAPQRVFKHGANLRRSPDGPTLRLCVGG